MGLVVSDTVVEPITIDECRKHLRLVPIDQDSDGNWSHPDDDAILGFLAAAREHVEAFLGLSVALKTYTLHLDRWPESELQLPEPPVVEVALVQYVDADEVLQTVNSLDYVLDNTQTDSWLMPRKGFEWPVTAEVANAVRITYTAGFVKEPVSDNPAKVIPKTYRAAILLTMAHLYENRIENVERAVTALPLGVEALLRPHRIRLGMA